MALKSFSKPQYAPISACSKSIRTNSRVSPQDRSKSLILWSVLSGSDIKALNKTLINELNELNALDAKCAKSDSVFISLQRDCKCRPVMTVDHNQRGATRDYIITFTFGCNWIRAFRTGERPAKVNRATAFPLSFRTPFRSRADEKSRHPPSASALRDASAKYADTTRAA